MEKRIAQSAVSIRKGPGLFWRTGRRIFRLYLVLVFTVTLAFTGGVLAVNAAVDPLWYWRGNIVTGENYAFNERFAKLNRFLRTSDRYDCLILGSSRVTLLDQTRITDYTCANLSFSAGVIPEFVATARYVKAQGFSPKLVIVGADAFNFWRRMRSKLPAFVKRGEPPPGWTRTYLAANAFNFSRRTLSGDSPFARSYDENFVGKINEDAPTYTPPARDKMAARAWKFEASRRKMFFELREVFPEARYVGYVPPISAWRTVEELYLTDYLDLYLRTMTTIAERFDAMYDFSAPSEFTMRPENTYDGGHYSAVVNTAVADVLQGQSRHFGIDVRGITLAEYTQIYNDAIIEFLNSIQDSGPRVCGHLP